MPLRYLVGVLILCASIPATATKFRMDRSTAKRVATVLSTFPKLQPGEVITLYPKVRYEDLHDMHPYAVKRIVRVLDPCYDPRTCKEPGYVFVEICVPPCDCYRIKVRKHCRKVEYDYGKYEIEIESKNGLICVEYDD